MAMMAADSLTRPNPSTIAFRFDTRGKAKDGVNFVPKDGVTACLKINTPSRLQVFYGPFRKPLSTPLDLDTRKACQ